jgi:HlyD family secretion protein
MKTVIALVIVFVVVGGGAVIYTTQIAGDTPSNFRTVQVKRADLQATINATGTVEPEDVVDVGVQVAGRILYFGPDPRGDENDPLYDPEFKGKTLDYTSPVRKDALMAVIDDTSYKAQRDQAKANLTRAEADLGQAKAKLQQAENDLSRAERLRAANDEFVLKSIQLPTGKLKLISDADYDLAVVNRDVARANVEVGKAVIEQNQAALQMAETNLGYTVIRSPVDGTIISRRVNKGQTVVASLNAPSIFLLAKDLKIMQVWAAVNEADIGQIKRGCPVHFSIDTFPGEMFRGHVVQIRLNAQMTQNVVMYTVIIATDNSNLRLMPYMTANVQFEIDQHDNVLQVPNAALRWKPKLEQVAADARDAAADILAPKEAGRRGGSGAKSPDGAKTGKKKERADTSRLWIKDDGFVRPVEVQIGISDGTSTEVSGPDLKEGMEAVIGESRTEDLSKDDTKNPFLPTLPGRGGGAPKQKQ